MDEAERIGRMQEGLEETREALQRAQESLLEVLSLTSPESDGPEVLADAILNVGHADARVLASLGLLASHRRLISGSGPLRPDPVELRRVEEAR